MFLDNATRHPETLQKDLTNLKLVFFLHVALEILNRKLLSRFAVSRIGNG